MSIDSDFARYAALAAKRLGWSVVFVEAGGKGAIDKDWPNKDPPFEEIDRRMRERALNYGLHLSGCRAAVVDVDGEEAEGWLEEHGIRSDMEVRTPRGRHVYTRLPEGVEEVRTRIRHLGMPVDLKLTGYCVGPGSWNDELGVRYAIAQGKRLLPPCELPEFPVELLKVEEVRTEVRQALAVTLPSDRARKYIDRIDPAIQGRNGSAALLRALQKILNLAGGDLTTSWTYAVYYNRTKCEPVWDEEATEGPDSLHRKLMEALKKWRPS